MIKRTENRKRILNQCMALVWTFLLSFSVCFFQPVFLHVSNRHIINHIGIHRCAHPHLHCMYIVHIIRCPLLPIVYIYVYKLIVSFRFLSIVDDSYRYH